MKKISDVYPLSPLQQGLFAETVYGQEEGMYFEQLHCRVRGVLDEGRFQQAWQKVVERHGSLRTSFVWEGLAEPLQVVRKEAELEWREEDWRGVGEEERGEELARYLRADRERGFELREAPLMRMSLLRLGPQEWEFVWSHHH